MNASPTLPPLHPSPGPRPSRSTGLLPAVAATGLLLIACSDAAPPPPPRNLLVLAVDTLRADALGALGPDTAPPAGTPRIDALADESFVFTRAISHASWTLPSFASTLTSTYTSTHGCWTFESKLPDGLTTLPEVFQDAGFATFGVASHIFFNRKYGLQQGFDSFDQRLGVKRGGKRWVEVTSPIVSAEGIRWMEERVGQDAPWLLWLHFFDPHMPYIDHGAASRGTTDESAQTGKPNYLGEVHFTDRYIGDVLDALERTGFAEETAVLFLSDHGEAFGEHAGVESHSYSLFQEELHVPVLLHLPGWEPRRIDRMTRTLDLMPTLLELFGLKGPDDQMAGRSLVPSLRGDAQPVEPLLSEIGLKPDGRHGRALSDGRWKLLEGLDGRLELYDLRNDPAESHDLSAEHPEVVARLGKLMDELQDAARARGTELQGEAKLEHSPEEMERIRAMGYAGNEED